MRPNENVKTAHIILFSFQVNMLNTVGFIFLVGILLFAAFISYDLKVHTQTPHKWSLCAHLLQEGARSDMLVDWQYVISPYYSFAKFQVTHITSVFIKNGGIYCFKHPLNSILLNLLFMVGQNPTLFDICSLAFEFIFHGSLILHLIKKLGEMPPPFIQFLCLLSIIKTEMNSKHIMQMMEY